MDSASKLTALKIVYNQEIHRVRVDLNKIEWEELKGMFQGTFQLKCGSFVVNYRDHEGDKLKVSNEFEFKEAIRDFQETHSDNSASIRFIAFPVTMTTIQEAADPILKALERLIESLTLAAQGLKEKAHMEDWARQCKRGLGVTGDAIAKAASDTRDSLVSAKVRFEETPVGQNVKAIKEEINRSIHEVTMDIQKTLLPKQAAEPVGGACRVEETTPASEHVAEVKRDEVPEIVEVPDTVVYDENARDSGSDTGSDGSWNVVSAAEPKEVTRWKAELATIHDIFPEAEDTMCSRLLDRNNGDIQVVLNILAEI